MNVTLDPCKVLASTPIIANTVVAGTLSASDCAFADETFLDAYSFSTASATTVDILMRSTAFDAYLLLFAQTATDPTLFADDNNSGGGTDARLTGPIPAGTYFILANSNVPATGAYTLQFTSPFAAINASVPFFSITSPAPATLQRVSPDVARKLRAMVRFR